MTQRTWQDNAAEYGALTKQGKDVRLALLVACSVRNGGKGGNARTRIAMEKTTLVEFARMALGRDTARERVRRHLSVWERMAATGAVPPAADMTPADALDFGEVIEAVQDEFAAAFAEETNEKPSGGRPRDAQPEAAVSIIERRGADEVVQQMSPQTRRQMRRALNEADLPEPEDYSDIDTSDVEQDIRRRQEREEDAQRSENYGVVLLAKAQLLVREMVEFGHIGVLRDFRAYVDGTVDSLSADELTPEMFS